MRCARIIDVIGASFGSSVIILLVRYSNGKLGRVAFDHRPFWYWFEDTGLERPGKLIGMWVGIEGQWGDQTITLPTRTKRELMVLLEERKAEQEVAASMNNAGNEGG